MTKNIQNSSKFTRGINIMNLRFWGGWFLAIACICIFLTMGCENGSLGVKPAVVMGRVVNKDNVSMGVANATVRMLSKEKVGSGDLTQGYNFLSTITDGDGYFVFEKVSPDNVIFEFTAPGYKSATYPAKSGQTEEDGSTSESADIDSVTVGNGATVDLRNVSMEKISKTIPAAIDVKIEFIDSTTKERIRDNEFISVSFDGVSYTKKAKAWRETGIEGILGADTINVTVRNESEPVLYQSKATQIVGTSNVYEIIELDPVTYSLSFQFQNVPDYIRKSGEAAIIKILIEDVSDPTSPPKNISINEVTNFDELSVIEVAAVRNPQHVRLRMYGYEDEVLDLTAALEEGKKGAYRIDINFDKEDGVSGDTPIDFAACNGVLGMKDNAIRKNVKLNMIGLSYGDKALVNINLPYESITWAELAVSTNPEDGCYANGDGAIYGTFNRVPTGYDMSYQIRVHTVASGSYIVTSDANGAVNIPVPSSDATVAKEINIDISKMTSAAIGG